MTAGASDFRHHTNAVRMAAAFVLALVIAITGPADSIAAQSGAPLQSAMADCDRGDKAACSRAGMLLSDVENPSYDAFIALRFLQQACAANAAEACGRLAVIFFTGEGDVEQDLPSAANFASRACTDRDRDGCEVAEAVFGDAGSAQFNAEDALQYRKVNCDFGRWNSCEQLARIYFNVGDYLNAEQVAAHVCQKGGTDGQAACDLSTSLKTRRVKMEQAAEQQRINARNQQIAEQQRKRALIDSFIRDGDYDGAVYAAIYDSRTTDAAAYALSAAHRAGAMGTIYKDLLYILDYWLPSGELNRIVNAEISRRSSGNDCGIFNCTNTPGASSRRWAAQYGGNSAYRPARSGGAPTGPPTLSSAEASKQVREKYRYAHCTMNNNANRSVC